MDQIKEAFSKVKEDINQLSFEMGSLKEDFKVLKENTLLLTKIVDRLSQDRSPVDRPIDLPDTSPFIDPLSTDRQVFSTDTSHTSTNSGHIKPSNDQNMGISTGNRGVTTDRQTHRQTHRQTQFSQDSREIITDPIKNAADILESLDGLKKEIRLKFKRLTEREILVFSTLYQLEEEQGHADYRSIAEKLSLTESSIRDYVGRLISKGIPVEKTKLNNKSIQLKISPELKKVASLNTILQLRDL